MDFVEIEDFVKSKKMSWEELVEKISVAEGWKINRDSYVNKDSHNAFICITLVKQENWPGIGQVFRVAISSDQRALSNPEVQAKIMSGEVDMFAPSGFTDIESAAKEVCETYFEKPEAKSIEEIMLRNAVAGEK